MFISPPEAPAQDISVKLYEINNESGEADYVLLSSKENHLCTVEAKKTLLSPLVGKEQARGYAKSLNCRFIILSNGILHYLWDLEQGNPVKIEKFPSQEDLEMKTTFNPPREEDEEDGINEDYLALIYSAADLMIVPSRQESFGQTASEAMSCGTPVIAYNYSGLIDIVDNNENGILIDPYDYSEMSKSIIQILNQKDKLIEFGGNARKKALREWSYKIVSEKYKNIYMSLIKK